MSELKHVSVPGTFVLNPSWWVQFKLNSCWTTLQLWGWELPDNFTAIWNYIRAYDIPWTSFSNDMATAKLRNFHRNICSFTMTAEQYNASKNISTTTVLLKLFCDFDVFLSSVFSLRLRVISLPSGYTSGFRSPQNLQNACWCFTLKNCDIAPARTRTVRWLLSNSPLLVTLIWRKSALLFIPRITARVFSPSRFFMISAKLSELSTRNLQYLSGHQFYNLCATKNFVSTIGWPQMTSEWRHVRAILMQNNNLQESLFWTQFLGFNQFI